LYVKTGLIWNVALKVPFSGVTSIPVTTTVYASVLPPSIYLPKFWKKMIAITP
jgi:hypothetical protein